MTLPAALGLTALLGVPAAIDAPVRLAYPRQLVPRPLLPAAVGVNGAVFQLVPQRFRQEIGVMTGLVGCAGGIGGFFLARALGASQGATGAFTTGFLFFSLLALVGLIGLVSVRRRWRTTWGAASGARI